MLNILILIFHGIAIILWAFSWVSSLEYLQTNHEDYCKWQLLPAKELQPLQVQCHQPVWEMCFLCFTFPIKAKILSAQLSIQSSLKCLIGLYYFSLIEKEITGCLWTAFSDWIALHSHIIQISARLCFPDLLGNLLQLLKANSEVINWSVLKLLLLAYLHALQPDREINMRFDMIQFSFSY